MVTGGAKIGKPNTLQMSFWNNQFCDIFINLLEEGHDSTEAEQQVGYAQVDHEHVGDGPEVSEEKDRQDDHGVADQTHNSFRGIDVQDGFTNGRCSGIAFHS